MTCRQSHGTVQYALCLYCTVVSYDGSRPSQDDLSNSYSMEYGSIPLNCNHTSKLLNNAKKSSHYFVMSTYIFFLVFCICMQFRMKRFMAPVQAFPVTAVTHKVNTVSIITCQQASQPESIHSHTPITRAKLNNDIAKSILVSIGILTASFNKPAWASGDVPSSYSSSTILISSLFDDVETELTSPSGGISYLQSCIDSKDFTSILEFTKAYDLDFRKEKMGKARKSLQDKEKKEKALYFANAVTFDLIGKFC